MQGEISILAHSLGSVLCYDVLSNQPHLHANLMQNIGRAKAEDETIMASFGSMQPMQSSDLDVAALSQVC